MRALSWAEVFSIEETVHHDLPSKGDELKDQIPTSCELGKRSTAYAFSWIRNIKRSMASRAGGWGKSISAL